MLIPNDHHEIAALLPVVIVGHAWSKETPRDLLSVLKRSSIECDQ